jgi:perosamine synthetase
MVEVRIRVGQPYFSEHDIARISSQLCNVLRSGWLTNGEVGRRFEAAFHKRLGVKFAISTNSCTAAMHTLMSVIGIGPGDEVVVPANTFASTANAVLYVGAKPVLADCDPDTFNVTARSIEGAVTGRTRAVIPVHIGGNPCEMNDVVKLCRSLGLLVVEDCAHALGSIYHGRKCGTFGIASAFSFYPTKLITSAEGGMIATNSARISREAEIFRNVGRSALGSGPIVRLGFNYRMSEIHACVGLNQFLHLDDFIKKRNYLARIYAESLTKIPWIEPQRITNSSTSAYYAYICKLLSSAPLSRDKLMLELRKKGIETTIMFRPLNRQPYFSRYGRPSACPNAVRIGNRLIVLPLHAGMSGEDVQLVVSRIRHAD